MWWVVNATPRPPYPRERPGTHCIGGWVGPRADLDRCRKCCSPHPSGIRSPDRPARSQSLYRLSYSGAWGHLYRNKFWMIGHILEIVCISCAVVLSVLYSPDHWWLLRHILNFKNSISLQFISTSKYVSRLCENRRVEILIALWKNSEHLSMNWKTCRPRQKWSWPTVMSRPNILLQLTGTIMFSWNNIAYRASYIGPREVIIWPPTHKFGHLW